MEGRIRVRSLQQVHRVIDKGQLYPVADFVRTEHRYAEQFVEIAAQTLEEDGYLSKQPGMEETGFTSWRETFNIPLATGSQVTTLSRQSSVLVQIERGDV